MGLGADVVLTPRDAGESFLASPKARAEVAEVQAAVAALPNVLGTSDPPAPSPRAARRLSTPASCRRTGRSP